MPDATQPSSSRSRRGSRTKHLLLACVALGAILVSVVLLTLLATKFARRFDVTVTGDMALAPRTTKLLATMEGEHRLIIATDLRTADPRAVQYLQDVLSEVEAAAARGNAPFRASLLDTSSSMGVRDFQSVTQELAQRDAAALQDAIAALTDIAKASTTLAQELEADCKRPWSAMQAAASDSGVRGFLEQGATLLSVRTGELRDAASQALTKVRSDPAASRGLASVPPTDSITKALAGKLSQATSDTGSLASQLRRLLQDAAISPELARSAQGALAALDAWTPRATALLQRLRELRQPDVVRLATALQAGQGAILVGPPGKGLLALDLEQLLPSTMWIDAAQASQTDLKRRVEELIATGIASLRVTQRPVVVLVHAEQRAFLNEVQGFDAMRQRLSMRGIDVVEWAIVASPSPDFSAVDPQRLRPVVYVTLAPDSAAARPVQGGLSGADRAVKLGEVVRTLFAQRANVAVSLNPSILPTYGEKDPLAEALRERGLVAMSGTPLLSRSAGTQGEIVDTDRVLQARASAGAPTHPLGESVRGLPTYFTWCIPLASADSAGPWKTSPIFAVSGDAATWGETQWLQLRQTPREARAFMQPQPTFDADRDVRAPADGVWPVVMTSEGQGQDAPRTLVVGSNDWFVDAVSAYPGNLELFESSVWWLSHHDDLLAQSATSRTLAIVKPVESGSLRSLRLALIVGLPALILVVGALYRLFRGA